jgi:hypothetical protein
MQPNDRETKVDRVNAAYDREIKVDRVNAAKRPRNQG